MAKKTKETMKVFNYNELPPSYAHPNDAGLDLRANGAAIINPGQTRMIGTGVCVQIPEGYFGALFARSGLATKYGLAPANKVGVIDCNYRGEIIVALHNHDKAPVQIVKGDKIAQLVIIPYIQPTIEYVEHKYDLEESDRGDNGFGSTGVR